MLAVSAAPSLASHACRLWSVLIATCPQLSEKFIRAGARRTFRFSCRQRFPPLCCELASTTKLHVAPTKCSSTQRSFSTLFRFCTCLRPRSNSRAGRTEAKTLTRCLCLAENWECGLRAAWDLRSRFFPSPFRSIPPVSQRIGAHFSSKSCARRWAHWLLAYFFIFAVLTQRKIKPIQLLLVAKNLG